MENETEEVIDTVDNEVVTEVEEIAQEVAIKPTETLTQRKARLERQLDQTNKKLGVEKEVKDEPSKKSDKFDYGEKAFLIANGVKDADEIDLTRKLQKETGKDLDDLVGSTYYQSELKNFREGKATAGAVIGGAKRTANSSINTVEYWIAKDEMPPASDQKLRQDYVNAKMKREQNKGTFYNQGEVRGT